MSLKNSAQAFVGALVVLATGIASALADNSGLTWLEAGSVVLTTLGSGWVVWYCANSKYALYAKAIVASISALVTALIVAGEDGQGISQSEWITALVAFVVGLGFVGATPKPAETVHVPPVGADPR